MSFFFAFMVKKQEMLNVMNEELYKEEIDESKLLTAIDRDMLKLIM